LCNLLCTCLLLVFIMRTRSSAPTSSASASIKRFRRHTLCQDGTPLSNNVSPDCLHLDRSVCTHIASSSSKTHTPFLSYLLPHCSTHRNCRGAPLLAP
jgi:hypothetical protein